MLNFPAPTVIRHGDTSKPDPFTILVVANPVLEQPLDSGIFVVDPIMSNPTGFASCVNYVNLSLFAKLPGQADPML